MGIPARPEEILSAPAAAARWLRDRGVRRVQLLLAEATFEEFAGLQIVDRAPEAVVVGDLGEAWTFPLLNHAFRNLLDGAELLAIQRNRYWQTDGGLSLDAGPFVAASNTAAARRRHWPASRARSSSPPPRRSWLSLGNASP
jgi:phospholysine phosphohistidine inorganic pyrophosphate phosphatase